MNIHKASKEMSSDSQGQANIRQTLRNANERSAHSKALEKARGGKKLAMSSKELYGYSPVKRDRDHKKRLGLP